MPNKPELGVKLDPGDPDYSDLLKMAGRIAKLLEIAQSRNDSNLRSTLDRFLGAVYAFILATHAGYQHRTGPPETDKINTRALDVEAGWIRTDGRWMAGFHFNSGLLRVAAVYHQALKIAAGIPEQRKNDKVDDLSERLKEEFPGWDDGAAKELHDSVNGFKHVPKHDSDRRSILFNRATQAGGEILDLLERWSQKPML